MGLLEITQYEKYLGLLPFVRRGKRESFNYIKENVWRKLQGEEGKLLFRVGREILLKSIIQAILTFAMRCFKLTWHVSRYRSSDQKVLVGISE